MFKRGHGVPSRVEPSQHEAAGGCIFLQADGTPGRGDGMAGLGVVVRDGEGRVLLWRHACATARTNNEAEYQAVIFGMSLLLRAFASQPDAPRPAIRCVTDSRVVVDQLNGTATGKSPTLRSLYLQALHLSRKLGGVEFIHVPRDANRLADALAWEASGGAARLMRYAVASEVAGG